MPKPSGPQFEAFFQPSWGWGSDYEGGYSAHIGLRPLKSEDQALNDVLHEAYIDWWGPTSKTAFLVTRDGNKTQSTDLGEHKTATSAIKAVAKKFEKSRMRIKPAFKEEDVRPTADMIQRMGPDEFKAATHTSTSMTGGKNA